MIGQAYFPQIDHPEGITLNVQDVKGKEWLFQFRFWPNNNSRMYVLEGITPCIQSMRLQAGDVGNPSVPYARLIFYFLHRILLALPWPRDFFSPSDDQFMST